MPDHNEVVDRTGIGDNELQALRILRLMGSAGLVLAYKKTGQISHVAMNIFDRCVDPHIVRLQKAVEFIAGLETEHAAQLRLRNVMLLVFLKRETLKGPARQIAGSRLERFGQFVRDLKRQFHLNLL